MHPVENTDEDSDWRDFIERWLRASHVAATRVLLIAGTFATQSASKSSH